MVKFRRRNWWFRRLALGLAFAAFAAPASAAIPLNAGIPAGAEPFLVDPYLTDVVARQGEALAGPDGGVPASELAPAGPVQAKADVAPADRSWAVSGSGAITFGIGVLGLALAFGLAAGRRPRIIGL